MFKSITTFVLSLLLVGSSVHFHSSYNIAKSEQGMCDVDCNNKQHKSSPTECDRCLNEETQRLISKQTNEFSFDESDPFFFSVKTNSTNGFLPIELYGRPPPDLL